MRIARLSLLAHIKAALDRNPVVVLTRAKAIRQNHAGTPISANGRSNHPKVYVCDSGLLHQLLGLETDKALVSHPKLGAS